MANQKGKRGGLLEKTKRFSTGLTSLIEGREKGEWQRGVKCPDRGFKMIAGYHFGKDGYGGREEEKPYFKKPPDHPVVGRASRGEPTWE